MKGPQIKHSPVPGCFDTDRPKRTIELVEYYRGYEPSEFTGPCTGYLIQGQLFLLPHDLDIAGEFAIRTICRLTGLDRDTIGLVKKAIIDPLTLRILDDVGYEPKNVITPCDIPESWGRIKLLHAFYGKKILMPADLAEG